MLHARTTTRKRRRRSPPGPVSTCTGPTSPARSFDACSRSGSRASTPTWRPTCRILASDRYAESFNETKALGDVNDPDPTRAEIARHWQAGGHTTTETGLWFKAALDVVGRRGTSQSLSRSARLFALLGMAIADGFATAWQGKFQAFSWRPGTAIREADLDGNPNTLVDPNWTPRNVSFGSSPDTLPAPQRWPVPHPPCSQGSTAPTASTSSSLARGQAP